MAVYSIEQVFPATVKAVYTDRQGGCSQPPYASYNLGDHVGDKAAYVQRNRQDFLTHLPSEPCWLNQVHGTEVVDAALTPARPDADAAYTRARQVPCVVMTADCLPVLLADQQGRVVAAAHAGWRGLANGVLVNTVQKMATPPEQMSVWLGPAIGPDEFQVGAEVREVFLNAIAGAEQAFRPDAQQRYLADLSLLARLQLQLLGVTSIEQLPACTYQQSERFFSYRRDGQTGRMACAIWLE